MRHVARALCLTPACIQLASEYVKNLSPNYKQLDTCTDFDEMVCGGWRQRTEVTGNQVNSVFDELARSGNARLRSVIEGPYPGESAHSHFSPRSLEVRQSTVDRQNFDKMKLAYTACMDEDAIARAGVNPVVELLDELEGVFKQDDLTEAFVLVQKMSYHPLLNLFTGLALGDTQTKVLGILEMVGLSLSNPSFYQDMEIMTEYTSILAEILAAVHPADAPTRDTKKLAAQIVKFEQAMATISRPGNSVRDPQYGNVSISVAEASRLLPQLSLEKVLGKLVPGGYSHNVFIEHPAFLSNLSSILTNTSSEAIKGFFAFKVIQAGQQFVHAPELYARWEKLRVRLKQKRDPALLLKQERWEYCMALVSNNLGWLVSRFFVEGFFSARDKELSDQILADIRHVYIERFKGLDWMDEETKKKAIEKVEKMSQKVGYPTKKPDLTSPESLQRYYAGMPISSSFFDNCRSILNDTVTQSWATANEPIDRDEWILFASEVNAAYMPPYNEILFPAGILQPPFFHGDLPTVVNYGAFGSVAGHEVSHGFDNSGRKYDANGKLFDWWGDDTEAEYNRRIDCFKHQFNNITITVPGAAQPYRVNGTRTLGENIADSAGVVASFEAWQKRRREHPNEGAMGLPGLEGVFTDEQLFFVAFANMWCTKTTPQGIERYEDDVHAPGEARVLGTVANSRAFREAFGCKVKEPTCQLF